MKRLIYIINSLIILGTLSVFIIGCNKTVTTNTGTNNNNNNNNYNNNPLNNDTLTGFPRIKFYTVMDYGDTKVTVQLNSGTPITIAKYYPSSQYLIANSGSNAIKVFYPDTTTSTVLNMQEDLLSGCFYSCFIYRVGYEWKISIVKDNVNPPSIASNAKIRVLDFRTQAYFDYVNIRVYNPGYDEKYFYTRNFLDHETYSSNADFKEVAAGYYHVRVYNDSANLKTRDSVSLKSGKIYSIILMTPSTLSPADALNNIFPDVQQHN